MLSPGFAAEEKEDTRCFFLVSSNEGHGPVTFADSWSSRKWIKTVEATNQKNVAMQSTTDMNFAAAIQGKHIGIKFSFLSLFWVIYKA